MARNYAALLHEYLDEMDILSDAEFGRLCRALLAYSADGKEVQLEGAEKVLWKRVKKQEDRFQESYEEQVQSKRNAGKKGAAKRWHGMADDSSAIAEDGTAITGIADDSKNGYTEIKTDTETKTKIETNRKEKSDAFSAFADGNPDLMEALRDFEKMRKTIKKPMTDRAKQMLVNKLRKEFPSEEWIAVLEQSISHCWLDVYEVKDKSKAEQYHRRDQSPYEESMEALKQIYNQFGEDDG